jgi:hypothetical protein
MALTNGRGSLRFDEGALADRLKAMPLSGRVLFACACAERLMPAYRWFCERSGLSDSGVIREALDAAWAIGPSDASLVPSEIAAWRERVEGLVPDDDDEALFPGSAVAQNAVAGVAYALRAWETADPQESVWAARQLYEAADVVVQQGAPSQTYVDDVDSEPPVQLMLRGMQSALQGAPTVDDLLVAAEADGQEFLKFLTGG